jgi:hypothetical protein
MRTWPKWRGPESLALESTARCGALTQETQVFFGDFLPVDLLLLVGIFGNIADADIEQTIRSVPMLCTPMATVIWTRHRRPPDVIPQIREWFDAAGCTSMDFASPGDGKFAVGSERVNVPKSGLLPDPLFQFRTDLW